MPLVLSKAALISQILFSIRCHGVVLDFIRILLYVVNWLKVESFMLYISNSEAILRSSIFKATFLAPFLASLLLSTFPSSLF